MVKISMTIAEFLQFRKRANSLRERRFDYEIYRGTIIVRCRKIFAEYDGWDFNEED